MLLHIVGFIIINWLLSAAWLADPIFALWAAVAVFFWWIAFYRRSPAWPSPSRRFLVYNFAIAWFLGVSIVIQVLWAYLIPVELAILWLIDNRQRRKRAAPI